MTNDNPTKSQFQSNLRKFVGIETNDSNLDLDKQENKLHLATVTKYFLCEDKVEVKLRDKNITWKCLLPHTAISTDCNISFSPDGEYKTDENGVDYLKPTNTYNCVVRAINNDYNKYGAVVLCFVSMDDTNHPFNSGEGGYKIQIGDDSHNTRVKIRNNEFTIKNENGELFSIVDGKVSLKNNETEDSDSNDISTEEFLVKIKNGELRFNENLLSIITLLFNLILNNGEFIVKNEDIDLFFNKNKIDLKNQYNELLLANSGFDVKNQDNELILDSEVFNVKNTDAELHLTKNRFDVTNKNTFQFDDDSLLIKNLNTDFYIYDDEIGLENLNTNIICDDEKLDVKNNDDEILFTDNQLNITNKNSNLTLDNDKLDIKNPKVELLLNNEELSAKNENDEIKLTDDEFTVTNTGNKIELGSNGFIVETEDNATASLNEYGLDVKTVNTELNLNEDEITIRNRDNELLLNNNMFNITNDRTDVLTVSKDDFKYKNVSYLKYKLVQSDEYFKVYTDNINVYVKIVGQMKLYNDDFTDVGQINEPYRPATSHRIMAEEINFSTLNIYTTGEIKFYNAVKYRWDVDLNSTVMYPKGI